MSSTQNTPNQACGINQLSSAAAKKDLFQMPSCGCGNCSTDSPQTNAHINKDDEHDHHHHEDSGNQKLYFARLFTAFILLILLVSTDLFGSSALLFYYIAYFLAGYNVLTLAAKNILRGKVFDENFLMAIASIGAFALGEYSEGVAVLIFYGTGEFLQELAVARSKRNIEDLMDIRPDSANLKTLSGVQVVAPEQVKVGDIIIVRPGEKIPLDGEVLDGESYIDTVALTGESIPRKATKGDRVLSGSVNKDGLLEVTVNKTYGESTVAKILDLVQHAGEKKAKSEKFITKFARYYTPAVVAVATLIAIIPPLAGMGTFSEWIYKSLSFLIISCPCALVLSIPISFFGGIGGAAKNGILVKGGNYLESLYHVKNIVFDKTGTITKGSFKVLEINADKNSEENLSNDELLYYAAIAEKNSTHPIAKSIIAEYQERNPNGQLIDAQLAEKAGKGIVAKTDNYILHVGNASLLEEIGISNLPVFPQAVVHIAKDNKYLGYILIADEIKESSAKAIAELKKAGINSITMLTGDTKEIANEVGKEVGISDIRSQLLPQDKVTELEKILAASNEETEKTAFVGDGINDAPVLTRADIGFAMGGVGSDAAIEAADIVIMNDDLTKIATAVKIAKKTRQIVVQNIVFCLGVKAAIMLLALFGITSIWFAVFADVGVAIIAIMNAMRAMFVK